MQNVLLINEDSTYEVLNMDEYIRYLAETNIFSNPVRQEIYRDCFPKTPGERSYISRAQSSNSLSLSLSDFPEEIRSLLILYEI